MTLFSNTTLEARQNKLAQQWNPLLKNSDWILVYCGESINKPGGLDQNYEFIPHPCYFWLTGERKAQAIMTYNKNIGWVEYRKALSRVEKIWDTVADSVSPSWPVKSLTDFQNELTLRNSQSFFIFGHCFPGSASAPKGDEIFFQTNEKNKHWDLKEVFDDVRRAKDADEIDLILKIAKQAEAGYKKIKSLNRVGLTERQIQIEYEAETFRAGSMKTPYPSIVGAGPNAAILHAKPSQRKVQSSDIILVDAGADMYDYCVDITRVFPAENKWSLQQKQLVDLVAQSQVKAISMVKPNAKWNDIHIESTRIIAEGLKSLGVIKSSAEDALETEAMALFYPHGVGHMVGLKVRDVGFEQNLNPKKYYGVQLRVDFNLKKDYILTVEPGCYFIEAYLTDPEIQKKYKDIISFSEAMKWIPLGGVRIEDDILVTSNGFQNLTENVEKF